MQSNEVDESSQLEAAPQSLRRSPRLNAMLADVVNIDSSLTHHFEPATYREAMKCEEAHLWKAAMQRELKAIESNHTWSPCILPQNRKAIGSKWVYKIKTDKQGKPTEYKARLVARGFTQQDGIDFSDVYAPVIKNSTFRIL